MSEPGDRYRTGRSTLARVPGREANAVVAWRLAQSSLREVHGRGAVPVK